MSWLNTNTVQGRFDLIVKAAVPQVLQLLRGRRATTRPTSPRETAEAVFDRAYASVNRPWLAAGTRVGARSYAGTDRGDEHRARRAGSASTRCRP